MKTMAEWAAELVRLKRLAEDPLTAVRGLARPPIDVGPEDELERYVTLFRELDVDHFAQRPAEKLGTDLQARMAAFADAFGNRFAELLNDLRVRVAELLDQGLNSAATPLIRTNDFHPLLRVSNEAGPIYQGGVYVGGHISCLPADHWLRSKLPKDDELYQDGSGIHEVPVLVLGPYRKGDLAGQIWPNPWYPLDVALECTRMWRAEQKRLEADKITRDQEIRAAEDRLMREDPEYRARELAAIAEAQGRRLAELEERDAPSPRSTAPMPVPMGSLLERSRQWDGIIAETRQQKSMREIVDRAVEEAFAEKKPARGGSSQ